MTGEPDESTFGSYTLLEHLGHGGMGEVWRALDRRLSRPVALKLLSPQRLTDADARARFYQETRACSALNHPNIVTVFEAGEYEGRPFLAMELIEGRTLRSLLADGPLPVPQALDVGRQVLMGLAEAHSVGILHRDIKPENVMIRSDGYAKLLDFGLAQMTKMAEIERLTATDIVVGTPLYMSPEQAMGLVLDPRSDVFSMGTVLYEMLAGNPPYTGKNFFEFLAAISQEKPAPIPGVPAELDDLLLRSLERERERRFADGQEMLQRLLEILGHSGETRKWADRRLQEKSIIVLPMASPADDQELSDGIVDEIILQLEKARDLRVIARSTSMRYRGREADASAVGRELNVTHAVEASLRRSGHRVRISVGLIDARDNFRMWGDRFESNSTDPFDLQDELSAAIGASLLAKLSAARVERATEVYDSGANRHYHLALQKLRVPKRDNFREALQQLEKAVELDPDFAAAHARLGEALHHSSTWFDSVTDARPIAIRASKEIQKALELEPNSPDAHFSMGLIELSEWQGNRLLHARRSFRNALATQPNHAPALIWHSLVSTLLGNSYEGESLARRALQIDPLNAVAFAWLSQALLAQGRMEDACIAAERGLRIDSRSPVILTNVLFLDLIRGHVEDARRLRSTLLSEPMTHPAYLAVLGIYEARVEGVPWSGRSTEDRDTLARTVLSCRLAADIPAVEGHVDESMALLRRAFEKGYRNAQSLECDPLLAPLHPTRAFSALCGEMREATSRDSET